MRRKRLASGVCSVGLLSVAGAVWVQSTPAETIAARGAALQAPVADILPPTIPIFPLPDVVLFPNVSLPLHIFEPRYRAMVADALQGNRIIGMVLLQPGYEADYAGRPPIYPIGSAGTITEVQRLPDGRFNIVLRGLVKFRVSGEDDGRPYRLAHVDALPELLLSDEAQAALRKERERLGPLLTAFLARSGQEARFPPEMADQDLVNALSQYLDLEPGERQALLERPDVVLRAQALIELLEAKAPSR